jgi:hypothetical protein
MINTATAHLPSLPKFSSSDDLRDEEGENH